LVFVIDTDDLVNFQHVNPDYKNRLNPEALMADIKTAIKTKNHAKMTINDYEKLKNLQIITIFCFILLA